MQTMFHTVLRAFPGAAIRSDPVQTPPLTLAYIGDTVPYAQRQAAIGEESSQCLDKGRRRIHARLLKPDQHRSCWKSRCKRAA